MALTRILLVCQANICRSPMALTVAVRMVEQAHLMQQLQLDAAGTHAVPRARPDARATAMLLSHGYPAPVQRARAISTEDFEHFDQLLAMDSSSLMQLQHRCPQVHTHKLHLFLDYACGLPGTEVPDPYFGSIEGFAHVLQLCELGAKGLIARHAQAPP